MYACAKFVTSPAVLRGGSRVLARPVSVSLFSRPETTVEQQDPFGEKRGGFDYQGLLARLSATHRRVQEKSLAENKQNGSDSDSDTSSSGTDPDSQGSSQP